MEEEKTEGLLLQTVAYLGSKKILKVFTPEHGLVSLMAKKSISPALTSPFIHAEWVYEKGKKEIHLLQDASLLHDLAHLREDYAVLSAAGLIAQDILKSQLPERKAPLLYALALSYLQKLPAFAQPEIGVASFRLKRLLHEGVLSLQNECAQCGRRASYVQEGESFCKEHSQGQGAVFSAEEWELLQTLAYARQFRAFQHRSLSSALQKKIELLAFNL